MIMGYRQFTLPLLVAASFMLVGCDDDDDGMGMNQPDFVTQVHLADSEGNQTEVLDTGEDATVVLTVRNRSGEPQTLEFSDERNSDFLIKNTDGEVVKLWSAGRGFSEVITEVDFEAGEVREFDMAWSGMEDDSGQALSPGEYEVQGWMPIDETDGTDDLRPSEFRSTLKPFEIVDAQAF